eukprot:TRINITY_DN8560_c0_g1_i1.p1 TRINITY_DN8560_c0_g1~~TRINITY_DN8560_c0_g1_i1.p1  ORF type:complete len:316 (-),score=31.94 TRINITY_DN8560_c0_g1_i1:363-1310(-)
MTADITEVECRDAVWKGTSEYLALFEDGDFEIDHNNAQEANAKASELLDLLGRINHLIDRADTFSIDQLTGLKTELEEVCRFHGVLMAAATDVNSDTSAVSAQQVVDDLPSMTVFETEEILNTSDEENECCPICFNNEEVILIEIARCRHSFCEDCIQRYFKNALSIGKVLSIRCPQPGCPEEIPFETMAQLMDDDWCAHYEELAVKALMRTDSNCKWCPQPGCETPVIVEGELDSVTCPGCRFKYCPKCLLEAHPKVTCSNYRTWKSDNQSADSKFSDWVLQNGVKKCPKCKMFTQKNKVIYISDPFLRSQNTN